MQARKEFNVPLPTLYATPENKHYIQFNSVQRGHQNMIESISTVQWMALFGSLFSPNAAWANVFGGMLSILGNILYMKGYTENYDDKIGRYKQGGAVKYIGILIGLVTSIMMGLSIAGLL